MPARPCSLWASSMHSRTPPASTHTRPGRRTGPGVASGVGMRWIGRGLSLLLWWFSTSGVGCGGSAAAPDAGFSSTALDAAPDALSVDAAPPIRHLGIEVDQPAGFDHGTQIDRVAAFGVDAIQLTFPWTAFEPDGNGLDDQVLGFLDAGMAFYRDRHLHVLLSVPIVDTVATFVPSDLAGK